MNEKISVELLQDNDAQWTEVQVEHYLKHAVAFRFTSRIAEDIRKNIAGGKACKADGKMTRFYKIKYKENEVGEILVTIDKYDCEVGEFSITIYDNFCEKGFAKSAINRLCEVVGLKRLEAQIEWINPQKERIEKLIRKCGFKKVENEPGRWYKEL